MSRSRFTAPFSESQLKAAAIVPKVAAFPSILGSLFIVQHVLRSKKRRGRVYHRILLWMSVNDFIYAVKAFVSTWPQPKDSSFAYGAAGTTATCSAAGFLGHGGSLTSICYNFSLTVFFLLVIRYGWKESQIKTRIEIWFHIIPFAVGWSTAIAGLFLELYNAFGWTCWINSFPSGCTYNVNCERGNNAGVYRWAFFHAELWTIFAFTLVAMILIYFTIVQHERTMERYRFRGSIVGRQSFSNTFEHAKTDQPITPSSMFTPQVTVVQPKKLQSSKFAMQATFYVVVFFMTWFIPMLQAVFALRSDVLYFPLILLASILSSMQGFWNAAVYLRPRWIASRRRHPNLSRWQVVQHALGFRDATSNESAKFSAFRKSPGMQPKDSGGSMKLPVDKSNKQIASAHGSERVEEEFGSSTGTTLEGNRVDNDSDDDENDYMS